MRRIGLAVILALSLALAPLAAEAQPPGKVYRMGYLYSGSATSSPRAPEAFREGLRELGWMEGRNIVIDYRFAEGRFDRLPDLAAEPGPAQGKRHRSVADAPRHRGQERHWNDPNRHDWRWLSY